ncbi:MAG: glycosyltransferase [Candidatus Omnitrophica bacterium]|nr:glycosyltransferase [Candidatus Omnitrophota bacterium]
MVQNFSVIIPARNAASTLRVCLEAIFKSSLKPYEVIVIDDGSSDQTAEIAASYSCRVIRVNFGKGPMQPRFAGAREAKTDLFVFIDADVVVKAGTFAKILGHFKNSEISAVTGILDPAAGHEDFFSAYKNEYMNYIFKKQPAQSAFLYGSLWAIRKNDLVEFDPVSIPFGSLVSDSEMGMRLNRAGKTVLLDHQLEIEHFKKYTFLKILRNDFVIPFMFSQMFLVYADFKKIRDSRGFSHTRTGQVITSFLAFAGFLSFFAGWFLLASAALAAVIFYWFPFLKFLMKKRGIIFTLKTAIFLPLDAAVMFCGMMAGFGFAFRPQGPIGPGGRGEESQDDKDKPLVSIVMPSYNYEKYLDRAIQSVLNQTYQNFELIVIDDGSKDNSLTILGRYKNSYPNQVKIFTHSENANRGVVKSYEVAFSKVRGELIAFLEADDFWYPANLEEKIAAFKKNPEAGVVFSSYQPTGDFWAALYWKFYQLGIRWMIPARRPVDLFGQFVRRNAVASFTHFMMRRQFLERIPSAPVQIKNFDWWVLGHLSVVTSFYFIPKKLTAWRIHRKSSCYGCVGPFALGRLRSFLMIYYQSLLQNMEINSEKREKLENAYAFLEAMGERKWGFLYSRMIRYPFETLRFLTFVLFRNLMFSVKGQGL